jgi:hypothetical protein
MLFNRRRYHNNMMHKKLNLHDREVRKRHTISNHDAVSYKFDLFDRRFGISHTVNDSTFSGVSGCEHMISAKFDYIDMESIYVNKAT